ncbi:MAG: rRNA maturation RNase YbeY [Alphaproteobacteria bacterium]|nr:rRNA maturation RNase YbeY [Alphaproteobacteria bacterium]
MNPDPDIGIRITAPDWRRAVPGVRALCRRAARSALTVARPPAACELAIILADDATLRRLNHAFRGHDKPTNVLAFPAGDAVRPVGAPLQLGDVVLAVETILAEARSQGKTPAAHVSHLVIHGVLHLLGFDHGTAAEARRMEATEVAVLTCLAIADPYWEGTRAAPRRP